MQMKLAAVVAVLLVAASLAAHPGIGIVIDGRGNLFYTDLAQVWMIAPNGTKSVAVPNVHTHELVLDAAGNLYGEHLWYEGDATKKWGHRVWKRSPAGKIVDVVPPSEGFLTNYSFVRDGAGAMYWVDHNAVMKRSGNAISVHARGNFRNPQRMIAQRDGTLWLIDGADLLRIAPNGAITRVAHDLSTGRLIRPDLGDHPMLMGLWLDRAGNVCVADFGHGDVKRVTPAGQVTTIAKSELPWSVSGGVYAPNGDLWLLEYSITNAARVRRIRAQ